MIVLQSLVRDLGVFSIGASLITLTMAYAIRQYFDKQLRGFQSELDREQVRFSDLHTTRADVISEFYAKLTEFDQDMRSLVDPMLSRGESSREEMIEQAGESGEAFRRYYLKHKIYFPQEVCNTMECLLSQYNNMFHEFSIKNIHDPESSFYEEGRATTWLENWKKLTENEVPQLKVELEGEFRDLLGVTEHDSD